MKLTVENINEYINLNDKSYLNDIQNGKLQIELNSNLYNLIGMDFYKETKLEIAKLYFELSILLDIYNIDAIFNLGIVYSKQNHLTLAKECFQSILSISSDLNIRKSCYEYIFKICEITGCINKFSYSNKYSFVSDFVINLLKNMKNNYFDNVDLERFTINESIYQLNKPIDKKTLSSIFMLLPVLENMYTNIDLCSKQNLLEILSYRVLGPNKVKLSLNTDYYWQTRDNIRKYIASNKTIPLNFMGWKLNHFKLHELDIPIEIYLTPLGIYNNFVDNQYEYADLKIDSGDHVIDAGGCYGDSALCFAHKVGERGRVYTFEFIHSNLEVLKTNLSLNKHLSERINIIERPLWSDSDLNLYYIDNGPGSIVRTEKISDNCIKTISIDDFVCNKKLEKIDFIKMDIEGAELPSLRGAENTIRQFRPKLAISIYHSTEEYATIFNYIDSLNLGYKFYVKHNTIYGEETVLYAIVP